MRTYIASHSLDKVSRRDPDHTLTTNPSPNHLAQADVTIGSRTAAEHATFKIHAVDGGFGGGKIGDRFAFTVFFDKNEAPVNYAIFGPKFTFTGEMVEGEITIKDPLSRP